MSQTRTPDECKDELAQLDQAHLQNETARDSFIAVAHTALFAASIAFIGDVVKLEDATAAWAVEASWVLNATGLVALSISYPIVARYIHKRRQAVYNAQPPECRVCSWLNWAALATFPLSVLALLLFVLANVGDRHDQQTTRDPTVSAGTGGRPARYNASSPATKPANQPTPVTSEPALSLGRAANPTDKRLGGSRDWKIECMQKDGYRNSVLCGPVPSPSTSYREKPQ